MQERETYQVRGRSTGFQHTDRPATDPTSGAENRHAFVSLASNPWRSDEGNHQTIRCLRVIRTLRVLEKVWSLEKRVRSYLVTWSVDFRPLAIGGLRFFETLCNLCHLPSTVQPRQIFTNVGFASSLWHIKLIGPESPARPLHETPGRMWFMALDDILNVFWNVSKLLFHIPSRQPKLLWWSLVWWNIRLSAALISLATFHPQKRLRYVEIIGECQSELMWIASCCLRMFSADLRRGKHFRFDSATL